MYSKRGLKRAYDYYNRRYFGNKLPRSIELVFATPGTCAAMGMTMIGFEPPIVMISEKIRHLETVVEMTLLHEMVHVFLGKRCQHGKRFQDEMLRLAKAGAMKELW